MPAKAAKRAGTPRQPRYDPAVLRLVLAAQLAALPVRFEPEIRFHPVRRWRLDWAAPDARLAVEIEGAVWTQGRHTRGSGFLGDLDKYNQLAIMGWRLLRITYPMIESGDALTLIEAALDSAISTGNEALHERGESDASDKQTTARAAASETARPAARPRAGRSRGPRAAGGQTRTHPRDGADERGAARGTGRGATRAWAG